MTNHPPAQHHPSPAIPAALAGPEPPGEEASPRPEGFGLRHIEATGKLEVRMRNIFLGSLLLSALLVLHLVFLARHGPVIGLDTIVRISFPSLLLWSLTMTAYAFASLWAISSGRRATLEHMAVTDQRTGVKSLEYIRYFLQQEYEKGLRSGQLPAILYVDLQNLDVVNRRFGHTVGDIALKGVAQTIERQVRSQDAVGRVAGDEFVVILPETTVSRAESVASAIEKAVGQYRLDLANKGQVDFLGCRVGVIACTREAGFADEIISVAQKAASESAIRRPTKAG